MDAIKEIEQMPPLPPCDQHTHWDYGLGDHGTTHGYSEDALVAYARKYGSQLIAARDAEIKESALKYVSLFGELQNALAEIEVWRLRFERLAEFHWVEPEAVHRLNLAEDSNTYMAELIAAIDALNPTQGANK